MTKTANPQRGEIVLSIDGEDFILCARMDRLASLMEALGVRDINDVRDLIFPGFKAHDTEQTEADIFDLINVHMCVRLLCISDNANKVHQTLRDCHLLKAGEAVINCLFSGVAEERDAVEETYEKKILPAEPATQNAYL